MTNKLICLLIVVVTLGVTLTITLFSRWNGIWCFISTVSFVMVLGIGGV